MSSLLHSISSQRCPTTPEFLNIIHALAKGSHVSLRTLKVPKFVNLFNDLRTLFRSTFGNSSSPRIDLQTLASSGCNITDPFILSIGDTCVLAKSSSEINSVLSLATEGTPCVVLETTRAKVWAVIVAWIWTQATTYESLRKLLTVVTNRKGQGAHNSASYAMRKMKSMIKKYPFVAHLPWVYRAFSDTIGLDFVFRCSGVTVSKDMSKPNLARILAIVDIIPAYHTGMSDIPVWFYSYARNQMVPDVLENLQVLDDAPEMARNILLYWIAFAVLATEAQSGRTYDAICISKEQKCIPKELYVRMVNHSNPTVALFGGNRLIAREDMPHLSHENTDAIISHVEPFYPGGMAEFKARLSSVIYGGTMATYHSYRCGVPIGHKIYNQYNNRPGYSNNASYIRGEGIVVRPSDDAWKCVNNPSEDQLDLITEALVGYGASDRFSIAGPQYHQSRARLVHLMFEYGCPWWLLVSIIRRLLSFRESKERCPVSLTRFSSMAMVTRIIALRADSETTPGSFKYSLSKYCVASSADDGTNFVWDCSTSTLERYVQEYGTKGVVMDNSMPDYTKMCQVATESRCIDKIPLPALTETLNEIREEGTHPAVLLYPKNYASISSTLLLTAYLASNFTEGSSRTTAQYAWKRCKKIVALLSSFHPAVSSVATVATWMQNLYFHSGDIRLLANYVDSDGTHTRKSEMNALYRLVMPLLEDLIEMLPWPSSRYQHGSEWQTNAIKALDTLRRDDFEIEHEIMDVPCSDIETMLAESLLERHKTSILQNFKEQSFYRGLSTFVGLFAQQWKNPEFVIGRNVRAPPEIIKLIAEMVFADIAGTKKVDSSIGWHPTSQLRLFSAAAKQLVY